MDGMNNNKADLEAHGWVHVIREGHIVSGERSQIALIIDELCASANDPSLANAIDELVSEARMAFHRRRPGDLQSRPVDFNETPSEFLEAISDAPDSLRDELIRSYETVWLHEPPETLFLYGVQASVIEKKNLYYEVDQIEYVAQLYLDLPGAKSPTLEWAIVNSLLYAESLAFLQEVAAMRSLLAGASSAKGLSIWKVMAVSAGGWIWEGLKLLATAAISYAIGQGDHTASIVLFLAITGARWFVPTQKKRQQQDVVVLAQAMTGAHRLAKRSAFNAGVVRQQAYHATTLGAVFSDYVFEILDRRILATSAEPPSG